MADRYPLVVDSSNYRIEEVPSGDSLDLNGVTLKNTDIIGVATISQGLIIGAGGTIVTIDSATGYIGLGTTNPRDDIDVGFSTITFWNTLHPTRYINFGADAGGLKVRVSSPGDGFSIISAGVTCFSGGGSTFDPNTVYNSGESGNLIAQFKGNDGNVGLGTQPRYPLEIARTSVGGTSIFSVYNAPPTFYSPADAAAFGNYGGLVIHVGKSSRECRFESAYGNSFFTFYTQPIVGSPTEALRITPDQKVGIGLTNPTAVFEVTGGITCSGALSKGSGSFRIDHPLSDEKHLVHSFIEGPQADLIYRGTTTLAGGTATVNLDEKYGLIEGTWEALCRDPQVWVTSDDGWTLCKGSVSGATLTITAQDPTCAETVSWLVVAERQDDNIKGADWTDENGRPILEPLKA